MGDNGPNGDFNVFVGNLAFKTTEETLHSAFSAAGTVKSAKIIMRGARSLGYGFVEFGTLAEAEKAVSLLNKTSLDDRVLNIEVARPRSEKPARAPAAAAEGGAAAPADGEHTRKPRRRVRKPRPAGEASGDAAPAAAAAPAERKPREVARTPKPAVPRPPSTDTVRVANLPFSVEDAALAALFAAHKPVECKVAMKSNGRSKGYAFVKFATEAQQKAALALNEHEVEGRKISVVIAPMQTKQAQALAAANGGPVDE